MKTVRTMDVAQAAITAGCHKETVRRAIRKHELLATHEPTKRGRGYVIKATDLDAWLTKRRLG